MRAAGFSRPLSCNDLFVSAGLLLCYDLPVQTDRDGRPINRFMVSRGRAFQQMLTTLIHEVEHLLLYEINDSATHTQQTSQASGNNGGGGGEEHHSMFPRPTFLMTE